MVGRERGLGRGAFGVLVCLLGGGACDNGGLDAPPPTEADAPLITYSGVVTGPTGWTLAGNVTAAGGACCGTYIDSSGGSYPIMFHMTPSASTPASATKTITGLTQKTAYTIAVKMRGNHWQTPPTLAITGGAQIVKAYSYMDAADENQWREHSFVVYTAAGSTSLTLVLSVYNNTLGATGDFALPRVYAGLPAVPAPEVGQAAFVATPARTAAPTTGQNLFMDPTFALFGTAGSPWIYDQAAISGSGATAMLKLTPSATITARAQQILTMWLPPSTTYTLSVKAGVTSGSATIYAYYLDDGSNVIAAWPYVFNVTNIVAATATPSTLPTQTFTFTTRARYSQVKFYFEQYRGTAGQAFFAAPTLTANGREWTDTPWATPPATTATFYDDFSAGLDPQKWLIPDKQWGGDNGGVYHTNVHLSGGNLVLEAHGDSYSPDAAHAADPRGGRRVGAAIVTRSYFASGLYEVRAKIPSNLGACTAFWPFHYINYAPGDAGYWAEPSPIRNTEIDWEMPTDYVTDTTTGVHSAISYNYQRENNWGGQWGGEGGESSLRNLGSTSIADGNFHTFGIRWKSGVESGSGIRTAGTVEWLIDGTVVRTFTGQTFGQDNVPFRGARFWIGIWFPAAGYHRLTSTTSYTDSVGWAGDPSFNTAQLIIQWVRITPIAQGRDAWVSETSPSGFYAPPTSYP